MARTKQVARRRSMRSGFVHGRDKRKREGEGEPQGQPLKRSRHHQAPAIAKASDMARFKELLKHVSWRSQHTLSTITASSSSSSSFSSHSHQSVWEQLPFELCLQIFGQVSWSQLLSCELVCRQWALFLRSWDELWAARFSELWLGGETQDLGEELRKENLRWRDLFCPEVMFGGGVFPLPKPSHPFFLQELSIPHLCFEDSTADSTPLEPEAGLLLQSVAQQYLFLMFKGSMQIARREWNEQNKDGDPELQVLHIRQWADEDARKHTPAVQPIPHQPSNTEEHSSTSSSSSPQRELWDMLTLADPYDKELPDRLREFHQKRWDKQPLRDVMGHTPLHIAFDNVEHFRYEDLVDVLAQAMAITAEGEGIELSEVLNATDNEGKTPLMMVKSANWDHGVNESELIVELFEDKELQPNLLITDKRDWTAFEHVLTIMEDVSDYSDDCCGVTVPHSFEGMPHTRKMKIAWCLLGQPYFTHQNIPILRRLFFGEGEEEEEEEEEEKIREVLFWRNELEDNKTLLHHLAENESADTMVLEWLAQVLNDTETWDRVVNASDGNGWAPLHCAVVAENMEMVQGLLELGADVHALTEEEPKRTALDLAVEQGDTEMAALLQDVMSESLETGHKVTEAEEEQDS